MFKRLFNIKKKVELKSVLHCRDLDKIKLYIKDGFNVVFIGVKAILTKIIYI